MKKLLAILLSIFFVLSCFVSCNEEYSSDDERDEQTEDEERDEDKKGKEDEDDLSAEDILKKIFKASESIDSYGMDMTFDLQMSAMDEDIDMTMDMIGEMADDVVHTSMKMDVALLGQSMEIDSYIDLGSDPMMQYTYTDGTWTKQELNKELAEMYKSGTIQMDMSMYTEYMKDMEVTEKENDGVDCYELTGVVDIDFLEFMEKMNMDSLFGDLEEAGLPENFFEKVFEDVDPFTMVLGVDKETFLPEYCNIDMTEMMNALMSSVMDIVMEQSGADAPEVDIEISKCIASATYRDYGDLSLKIPKKALSAKDIFDVEVDNDVEDVEAKVEIETSDDANEAVKAYVDSANELMQSMADTFEAQGVRVTLVANGTEVVYIYTMIDELTEEQEQAVADTKSSVEELAKNNVGILQNECPEITAVSFRYYTIDGRLLFSARS